MIQIDLHHGDCLEVMSILDDDIVDAVFTDMPYEVGFEGDYAAWISQVVKLMERKCKPGSPLFVQQAMLSVRRFAEWFPRDWRLIVAPSNHFSSRCLPGSDFDPMLLWWTEGSRWQGISTNGAHASVVEQTRSIIERWVRPGGVVLDPFMGRRGTTGVACAETGHNFIGIEIDADRFEAARLQVEEAQSRH